MNEARYAFVVLTAVRRVAFSWLLGVGAFAGACTTDNPDEGRGELSPEQRAELEEFCVWWGELDCRLDTEAAPHSVSAEHCVTTQTAACTGGFIPRIALSIAEGRLVYHPENRAAVEADLGRLGSYSWTAREALESWRALFQGTVENGQPCHQEDGYWFYVNECENGYCPWNDCPGTCRPYPGPEDECDWSERPCRPSDYCYYGCKPLPSEGDACEPDGVMCLPPFRCVGTEDGTGICGLAAELDEPCVWTTDCVAGACHDGTCALSGIDEACAKSSECSPDLSCLGEVCAPRGAAQDPCMSDRDCADELQCYHVEFAGWCAEPLGVGSGCQPYQSCPKGLVCKGWNYGGTCSVPGAIGDACTTESCRGGSYCSDSDFASKTEGVCRGSFYLGCDPT